MNCREFQNCIYEYLDQGLGPAEQAAAREHVAQCDLCRRALLREEAVASAMQQSLERATAGLSVRPATRRAVLQAIESPKPAWDWRGVWRWLTTAGLRPALASAVVLVLLLVVSAHYFPRRSAAPAPVAAITPSQHTWVIDVPIRSQTHVYSRERGSVLDAIAPQVSFAHARFLETKKSQ